jgi:NAD-dependent deacetylase
MANLVGTFVDWVRQAQRLVVLTGAGISTESGLPDFRSPGGLWSRYRPVSYPEFLRSKESRKEYWARYLEFFPPFIRVQPNDGHRALAELERRGRLMALITQNIDRLHAQAGTSPERLIELHGRIDRTLCLACGRDYSTQDILARVTPENPVPHCDDCGGWLKPATISFGQELPARALERAVDLAQTADLFLSVGSSLTVYPVASLPGLALDHGARLVILNAQPTPYDEQAHLVLQGPAGPTLRAMIQGLDRTG